MTTPKPTKAPKVAPSLDDPYHPLDPIPAVEASERSSDTVWSLWKDVVSKEDARYADTVPLTVPGASTTSARVPAPPASPSITLDEALVEARRNNRVCPRPERWLQLWQQLASRPGSEGLQPPLTGAAWTGTSSLGKRMSFRDNLEWAAQHGCLQEAYNFLKALPEDQWHHMGD